MSDPTRSIEEVVAEASEVLRTTGTLDVEEWVKRYPEHEAELRRLIPVQLRLEEERRWMEVEERANTFAANLIKRRTAAPGA